MKRYDFRLADIPQSESIDGLFVKSYEVKAKVETIYWKIREHHGKDSPVMWLLKELLEELK